MQDQTFQPRGLPSDMASEYMPQPEQPMTSDVPQTQVPVPDSGYRPLPFGGMDAMQDDDEEFQKTLGELTLGKAADVGDLETAFDGIYNGDPVGLESFDLGFFKDGTPAIVLNGAPVPIEQSMWLALLNKRQATRQELDQRMRFEVERQKASDFVSKTVRSVPNIPAPLAQALIDYTQLDPQGGVQNALSLLPSMSADGGKRQTVDLMGKMHRYKVGSIVSGHFKSRGRGMVQQPSQDPLVVMSAMNSGKPIPMVGVETELPSPIQERLAGLQAAKTDADRTLKFAYQNFESVVAPPDMVEAFGDRVGMIELSMLPSQFGGDGGIIAPLSRMSLIMDMASDGLYWGTGARPKMDPPPVDETTAGTDPRFRQFVDYLTQLDLWAASNLGYGRSSEQSIVAMALSLCKTKMQNSQPQTAMPASAPAVPAEPQGTSNLTNDLLKGLAL